MNIKLFKQTSSFVIVILLSLFLTAEGNTYAAKSSKKVKSYSIKSMTVHYVSGSDTVSAFLAYPEGKGPFPALIMEHEWWGLTPWMKENAESFAKRGYVALAIDLYRGKVTSDPKVASELSRSLPHDRAVTDLKSAYSYLTAMNNVNKKKVGSIGWCMGGGYSLLAAINIPKLDACVINYGHLVTDKESLDKIDCPVLNITGTEDKGIPPEQVKEFAAAMKKAGKKITYKIYPGVGHAFMNPANVKGYKKEQAEEAWKKIHAFLDARLMKK